MKEEKPDLQRAQKMMRESLGRMLVRCGLRYHWDLFVVVSMVAVSATYTEVIGSDKIQDADGVEKMVKFATDEFGKLLREDLTARMLAERKAPRH